MSATPRRGSDLSRGMVGRVSANLISDPDQIHKLLSQLVKDNPDAFDSRRFRRFPTSIETLDTELADPDGPPRDEAGPQGRVTTRSSARTARRASTRRTDGVVPYRSCPPRCRGVREREGRPLGPRRAAGRRRRSSRSFASSASTWGRPQPRPPVQEARGPAEAQPVKLEPPATSRSSAEPPAWYNQGSAETRTAESHAQERAHEYRLETPTAESPEPEDDPYRYGWRYVPVVAPDGTESLKQVPLTLVDVLFPEPEDFIVHERGASPTWST